MKVHPGHELSPLLMPSGRKAALETKISRERVGIELEKMLKGDLPALPAFPAKENPNQTVYLQYSTALRALL